MTAGAQNASGRPTESSEKGKSEPKPVTRTEETTQSSRKRGRDTDPPASNPKKAKAIQPGKIKCEQVLMKIGRELETTQSSRKRGRDADPPASNPKRAKAIQPGKIEGDQVLMKIGRELETTQSSRKRGRDTDPPASNPKRAKAIQPGKIEGDQVLMKIGRELETTQSSRKRGRDADPPASNPKRAKAIQPGKIEGDQVLMKIGRELGVKWMDVGVALGINFIDLKHTIKDDHNIEHHLKPMEMFQKWKSKAGDSFTYATLASALEEVGLDTCAQTHCYE